MVDHSVLISRHKLIHDQHIIRLFLYFPDCVIPQLRIGASCLFLLFCVKRLKETEAFCHMHHFDFRYDIQNPQFSRILIFQKTYEQHLKSTASRTDGKSCCRCRFPFSVSAINMNHSAFHPPLPSFHSQILPLFLAACRSSAIRRFPSPIVTPALITYWQESIVAFAS